MPARPPSVLALGSCRVHDPLMAVDRRRVRYLNRLFRSRAPIYLHDVHEMIQFVRLARGELAMPTEIGRFAFPGGLRVDKRMSAVLGDANDAVDRAEADRAVTTLAELFTPARWRGAVPATASGSGELS